MKFGDGEEQMVIVEEITTFLRRLLSCAGNPCRDSLMLYKQVYLLSRFTISIKTETGSIKCIPLTDIKGKGVLIKTSDRTFVVLQLNNFERH